MMLKQILVLTFSGISIAVLGSRVTQANNEILKVEGMKLSPLFTELKFPKIENESSVKFFLKNGMVSKKPEVPIEKTIKTQMKSEEPTSSTLELLPTPPKICYGEGNTYAPGQCTWYVKDYFKTRVGDYWGNAINWANAASADVLLVDKNPVAESTIVVFGADPYNMGYGHVAIVIAVGDGVLTIREMNYGGAWKMN